MMGVSLALKNQNIIKQNVPLNQSAIRCADCPLSSTAVGKLGQGTVFY